MIVRWNRLPFKLSVGTVLLFGALAYLLLQMLQSPGTANAADPAEAFPPLQVETVTVDYQPLRTWTRYSGRLAATEQAAVRPLVSGTIQQVLFEDGSYVEAGQVLFVIDPRPFAAAVQRASAELVSAESAITLAQVEFDRAEGLADRDVVSRSILDHRRNDLNNARARRDAAKAELVNAELQLDYAHVKAPFAGRAGRAEVTVGNVVGAGVNAPVLTHIVSMDELYAEFDVDEARYFELLRGQQSAQRLQALNPEKLSGLADIPVDISVNASGNQHSVYRARLYAFDNQLDVASGTIRARAVIENADQILLPGMFADINLGSVSTEPTLLVPERAISPNQDRRFVYVVTDDGRTEYRELRLGQTIEGQRVVLDGLASGERVVVNGLHRLSNDMPVSVAQH
ncbi:MAG: efflux RND transporter periplasmic adaptor subunit [Pseudohongiella sp.]|uniref:efflux RND transporter periplasmic adaptor subunit n=1 Tax=Pseudohongiella sp. TaxID=1979412 RepID=UPI0034A033AE